VLKEGAFYSINTGNSITLASIFYYRKTNRWNNMSVASVYISRLDSGYNLVYMLIRSI